MQEIFLYDSKTFLFKFSCFCLVFKVTVPDTGKYIVYRNTYTEQNVALRCFFVFLYCCLLPPCMELFIWEFFLTSWNAIILTYLLSRSYYVCTGHNPPSIVIKWSSVLSCSLILLPIHLPMNLLLSRYFLQWVYFERSFYYQIAI